MFKKRLRVLGAAFLLAVALSVSLTVSSVLVSRSVPSSGEVEVQVTNADLGVYSDGGCQNNLTSVNWGSLQPGGGTSKTVYLRNHGNVALTLSLSTSGWNPSVAASYITVSWDKAGVVLGAGQTVAAVLSLNVSASITGVTGYSVDLVVSGSS